MHSLTRRRFLCGASVGTVMAPLVLWPKRARAQSLDRTITEGFVTYGMIMYNTRKLGFSPPEMGGWADLADAYIGAVQQLRTYAGFDQLSDQAFASRPAPDPAFIDSLAATLIQRGVRPSCRQDLENLMNDSVGHEDELWQNLQARGGYDDIHAGNAGIFEYFDSLNPQGPPPDPVPPCEADDMYCWGEPFLGDPYSYSFFRDPSASFGYPWWNANFVFFVPPKPRLTKADICFYATWGLRYVGLVLRFLGILGTVAYAPIIGTIGTIALILTMGSWIVC